MLRTSPTSQKRDVGTMVFWNSEMWAIRRLLFVVANYLVIGPSHFAFRP